MIRAHPDCDMFGECHALAIRSHVAGSWADASTRRWLEMKGWPSIPMPTFAQPYLRSPLSWHARNSCAIRAVPSSAVSGRISPESWPRPYDPRLEGLHWRRSTPRWSPTIVSICSTRTGDIVIEGRMTGTLVG